MVKIPHDPDARAGLAVGYYAIGKKQKAIELYTSIVEDPELKENCDYLNPKTMEERYLWPQKALSYATRLIKQLPGQFSHCPSASNR
jgi:hypothetical protein